VRKQHLRSLAFMVSLMAFSGGLTGCGNQAADYYVKNAASISDTAALAVEGVQGAAAAAYEGEQRAVLAKGKEEGWTTEKIKAEVQKVRDRWDPAWAAFDRVRVTHDKLREAISLAKSVGEIAALMADLSAVQKNAVSVLKAVKGGN